MQNKFFSTRKLEISRLVNIPNNQKIIEKCAKWAEDEWGILNAKDGMEYEFFQGFLNPNRLPAAYVLLLNENPIGMFVLENYAARRDIVDLQYVYIDKNYRERGFGNYITVAAELEAKKLGYGKLVLRTFKPRLNKLYEKVGALNLGDTYIKELNNLPVESLAINLDAINEAQEIKIRPRGLSI